MGRARPVLRRPSTPKPCASSSSSQASWRSHERDQLRHRRDVAVHAEHRVGDDELAARPRRGEQPPERGEIEMRIALELARDEQRGVVQRGMVQPVGEHRVLAPRKRRDDAEVRHVAGGEQQRARQADECRQPLLQLVVRGRRAPGSDATRRRRRRSAPRPRARPRSARDGRPDRGSRCCRRRCNRGHRP